MRFDIENVFNGLVDFGVKLKVGISFYGDIVVKKLEVEVKENVLWIDRIGLLRKII